MAKPKKLSPFEIATRRMRYLQVIKKKATPALYDYINRNRDGFSIGQLSQLSTGDPEKLLPRMTAKFDVPFRAAVEPMPEFVKPTRGRLAGSSVPVLDKSPIQVEQAKGELEIEADLKRQNQNADTGARADAQPNPDAHAPKQTPMTAAELDEVAKAKNHFASRRPKAVKFYNAKDWRAWRTIKAYEKRVGTSGTVWGTSPAYDEYSIQQKAYSDELNNYAKDKYGDGTPKYKEFMDDYSLDRGHINAKGNRGFSHQMDVTSNIGPEVRTINRESGAKMSLREWLEGMNQADMEQQPRIRAETERRLSKLSTQVGEDSALGKHIRYLRSLPQFKGLDTKFADNKFLDINMFDSNPDRGVFMRSMRDMIASGDIKDAHEYERMRRFFLTAMDGNPEFDLQSFMREGANTGSVPQEFIKGLPEDGKLPVDWEEVVRGNKSAAKIFANKKALLARIVKYGLKAPEGVLLFLAGTGASYALSDKDKTYLEVLSEGLDREIERTEGTGYNVLPYNRQEVHTANDQFWTPNNTGPAEATKFAADAVAGILGGVTAVPYNLWQDRNKPDTINDPANSGEGQVMYSNSPAVQVPLENRGLLKDNWT